jgi:hypothetical protein
LIAIAHPRRIVKNDAALSTQRPASRQHAQVVVRVREDKRRALAAKAKPPRQPSKRWLGRFGE